LKLFGWLAGGISVAALSLAPVLLRAQAKVTPVPDAQVESSVLKALAANSQLAGQPIQTSTVTLSGNVRDEPSRKAAESIVSQTPGVLKVIDELTLNSDAAGTQSREGDGNSQNPYTPSNRDASNAPLQSDATLASAPLEPAPPSAPVPSQRSPLPSQSQEDQARSQQGGETRKSAPIERPYSQPPYAQSPTVPPPYPPSPNRPVPRPAYPNPAPSATQPYVTQPYAAQSYAAQSYAAQPEGQSVTVPAGSLVRVRVNQELDSEHTPAGTVFDAVVLNDVIADGFVAVPRGATIQGVVAIVENSPFNSRRLSSPADPIRSQPTSGRITVATRPPVPSTAPLDSVPSVRSSAVSPAAVQVPPSVPAQAALRALERQLSPPTARPTSPPRPSSPSTSPARPLSQPSPKRRWIGSATVSPGAQVRHRDPRSDPFGRPIFYPRYPY